ncbi:MAG: alpha/beta hydrolase [Lachnospiraceae bacterium]|nr:alpha/beta hydrolase [Lachnospiraceae bacterium]
MIDHTVQTVDTGSLRMNYLRFGEGSDTLVVLPGISPKRVLSSAASIAEQYACLAKDYTVYLFERKENMEQGYLVADMARDTADAARALGLSDIYLYGISQGGMIALTMAIEYPELVKKIAVASSSSRESSFARDILPQWTGYALAGDAKALTASFADHLYSDAFLKKYRRIMLSMNLGLTSEDYERFIIQVRACEGYDIYNRLGLIKCPLFVIGGKNDKIVGLESMKEIAEATGCEIYIFENGAHAVYDEEKDCIKRVADFFTGDRQTLI